MSFRRNFRNFAPRGRGNYRGGLNQEFAGANIRKNFYSNGYNDGNDDDSLDFDQRENNQDGESFKSKRAYSTNVQSDLHTIRNFSKQFQNGEKKNWPKILRDMNKFFVSSESFPATLSESPQRYSNLLFHACNTYFA